MDRFAATPEPPYYMTAFSSQASGEDVEEYGVTAARLMALAHEQPGCLGVETTRDASGFGITLAFFDSDESIRAWKRQADHLDAQRRGREVWYERYEIRVARVERAYGFPR